MLTAGYFCMQGDFLYRGEILGVTVLCLLNSVKIITFMNPTSSDFFLDTQMTENF
jgi:hypothetical protein